MIATGVRWLFAALALLDTAAPSAGLRQPGSSDIIQQAQAVALSNSDSLETAIQSAALMMQFIWRLHRLAGTIENFDWGVSDPQDRQRQSRELASILRGDQDMALDTYMKLLVEIAAYPDAVETATQVANSQKEYEMTGHAYMQFFLRLLTEHLDQVRHAETPSSNQILSDIFARNTKSRQ